MDGVPDGISSRTERICRTVHGRCMFVAREKALDEKYMERLGVLRSIEEAMLVRIKWTLKPEGI
jgi:hypothetical protein